MERASRAPSIALALAGALVLWPLVAARAAEPPARVKVVVIEGMQLFPLTIMQTRGIAEKHRLQIELVKAPSPQGLHTVLQAGEVNAGFAGWVSIAVLRSHGVKLSNVYSLYGFTNDLMVTVDSPLKGFGDLKGKRIGVFGGPNSANAWMLRLQAVKFFGFDPVKDAKVHYGAPPLLMGMLEKGELDGMMSLDPLIARMLDTGKFRSIAPIGDLWRSRTGQDPMLVAVTVNEPWAKEHPLVARRFVAAVKESIEYLRTHQEAWPELARSVGIPTERGATLLRERTLGAFITRWDQKFIDEQLAYAAEVVKTLGEASGMPKPVPAGTFDLSYAP